MRGSAGWGEALVAALAAAAMSICVGACGQSSRSAAASGAGAKAVTPASKYMADEDGEVEEGIRSVGYRDADDGRTIDFGRTAGRADTRAVTSVVARYHAATAAGDARKACAVLTEPVIKAVGVDYDRTPGHRSRAGKTCEGGMAFLFKTYHAQMTAPSTVTGVRVKGSEAYALLGSPTARAGFVTLQREHGRWRLSVLLTLGIS